MKLLFAFAGIALATAAQAQSFREAVRQRNPIIYNHREDEIGVIHGVTERDGRPAAVVQLVHGGVVDLGYFSVALPAATLMPRARGGWYTSIGTDQLPNIRPYTVSGRPVFFRTSGVN